MKELSWFDPSTDWQEQEADPRFQLLTPINAACAAHVVIFSHL